MEKHNNPYRIDEAELKPQRKSNGLEKILELETDRGVAILGTAYIDERLREIILNYLRDSKVTKNLLDKQIQSLDARSSLAFALGQLIKMNMKELTKFVKFGISLRTIFWRIFHLTTR